MDTGQRHKVTPGRKLSAPPAWNKGSENLNSGCLSAMNVSKTDSNRAQNSSAGLSFGVDKDTDTEADISGYPTDEYSAIFEEGH